MNIQTQLTQYATAQDAAQKAHQALFNRINASAMIIRNVYRKRFRDQSLPAEMAWINIYYLKGAVITMTEDTDFPVLIEHEGKTYHIPRIFVFGSTWDIAKEARKYGYRDRYTTWSSDVRRLGIKVQTSDRTLQGKIDAIRRKAEAEITSLQRDHERQFAEDKHTLSLRERQVKKIQKHFITAN